MFSHSDDDNECVMARHKIKDNKAQPTTKIYIHQFAICTQTQPNAFNYYYLVELNLLPGKKKNTFVLKIRKIQTTNITYFWRFFGSSILKFFWL